MLDSSNSHTLIMTLFKVVVSNEFMKLRMFLPRAKPSNFSKRGRFRNLRIHIKCKTTADTALEVKIHTWALLSNSKMPHRWASTRRHIISIRTPQHKLKLKSQFMNSSINLLCNKIPTFKLAKENSTILGKGRHHAYRIRTGIYSWAALKKERVYLTKYNWLACQAKSP